MSILPRGFTLHQFVALVCLLGCASFLGGCWHKSEMVTQEEGRSYLRVLGNVTDVEMELDGSGKRQALALEGQKEPEVLLLQVRPGRHLVDLYRGGKRIVHRDLYFGLGQVVEISVPQ